MQSPLTLHVVTPLTGMGLPAAPVLTAALGPGVRLLLCVTQPLLPLRKSRRAGAAITDLEVVLPGRPIII